MLNTNQIVTEAEVAQVQADHNGKLSNYAATRIAQHRKANQDEITMAHINNTADTLDIRDLIERVEELRETLEDYENPEGDLEAHDAMLGEREELAELEALMSELCGNGGDEQWEGDWYPLMLIRDSYFTDYMREQLEDCGTIPKDLPWFVSIDWEQTAEHCKVDYSSVEIDGVTYWYR